MQDLSRFAEQQPNTPLATAWFLACCGKFLGNPLLLPILDQNMCFDVFFKKDLSVLLLQELYAVPRKRRLEAVSFQRWFQYSTSNGVSQVSFQAVKAVIVVVSFFFF